MNPVENLIYYAAVVENTKILADYHDAKAMDCTDMAAKCLVHIPPLHNSFSFTTCNRMFICLIEGLYIYCAIMDEALGKAKAFMFLEHVRDAFEVLLQQREPPSPRTFHHEMGPFFYHLASSLVGMPQREKLRIKREQEELLQAQQDAEAGYEVSSPSAVAPLKEMNDEEYDQQAEEKRKSGCLHSSRCFIGKGKWDKKKLRTYDKGVPNNAMDRSCEASSKEMGLEILIGDRCFGGHGHQSRNCGWQSARSKWWWNVKVVLLLDLLVCVVLLAIWLSVCKGIQCLKGEE